jgi:soluble lytic murein transglycosylase-like protein
MKSNKSLIVFCAVIYTALFSLIGALFIEVHISNKRQIQQLTKEIKAPDAVSSPQRGYAAIPTITIVNYGTVNMTVNSYSNPLYIQNIINARTAYDDPKFTGDEAWDNASSLFSKIAKYAADYNINLIDALTLVHVESDFKEDAHRKDTTATGLCQITKICLSDFNDITKKNYTMHDMFDVNKNLEVGFWYFARLLDDEYYGKKYLIENIEDAYLAYNCGPKYYKDHKYELKNGTYRGYSYGAGDRWGTIANLWAA